jgi:hypothetical protein
MSMGTPAFIIVGAARCGTTSLYRNMIQHPSIVPASKKEIHYFDNGFRQGISWYRSQFIDNMGRAITGEASPYYMYHPLAPRRIANVLPNVKLIVLLRNPVDRAYSNYWLWIRTKKEFVSFEAALKAESVRIKNEESRMIADENYYSFNHQFYSYLSRGIYVDQVKVLMNLFKKEQILILKSEDFYATPEKIMDRVWRFLRLPYHEIAQYKRLNRSSYPKMEPELRRQLNEYFSSHNERLYNYLGIDFGW